MDGGGATGAVARSPFTHRRVYGPIGSPRGERSPLHRGGGARWRPSGIPEGESGSGRAGKGEGLIDRSLVIGAGRIPGRGRDGPRVKSGSVGDPSAAVLRGLTRCVLPVSALVPRIRMRAAGVCGTAAVLGAGPGAWILRVSERRVMSSGCASPPRDLAGLRPGAASEADPGRQPNWKGGRAGGTCVVLGAGYGP